MTAAHSIEYKMPTKRKPKSPEQIAAARLAKRIADFEAVNLHADAATLLAHQDIHVLRAGDEQGHQRVKHDLARRLDAFDALRKGMAPGAYDAARRLERDMIIRRGEHDHGRPVERVQGDAVSAFNRNDQIIAAGQRVDAVLKLLSERDGWLLTELAYPTLPYREWRAIVAYITGETHDHAQGAAVRSACVNLRDAYHKVPRPTA